MFPQHHHPDIDHILLDQEQIQSRVATLAAQINTDYAHASRLVLIGILKGSFLFLADLARYLTIPHIVDFMALSSYGMSATSSGIVRINLDLRTPLAGEHVLVIEDIIDTGLTLQYLQETLKARHPASLRFCVLLDKAERRQANITPDYTGFTIPDVWVVGYGLDYAERFRTLPHIGVLKPEVYS